MITKIISVYLLIGLILALYSIYFNITHDNYKIIEGNFSDSVKQCIVKVLDFLSWVVIYPYWIYKFIKILKGDE